MWFRRDLRIADNISYAQISGEVLPIFIFDTHIVKSLPKGDRRVSFIFKNLLRLKEELKTQGLDLAIFYGEPLKVLEYLRGLGFGEVYFSYDNDAYARNRDAKAQEILECKRYNDTFLFESDEILNNDEKPYKVFTPFYKKSLQILSPAHYAQYTSKEKKLAPFDCSFLSVLEDGNVYKKAISLEAIGFSQSPLPDFATASPHSLLERFKERCTEYELRRDFLDTDATSKLGVHLRFGTIGIREVVRELKLWQEEGVRVAPFYRELIWREFWNYLLVHFPHSESENFLPIRPKWRESEEDFAAWREGRSGIPIVDAAMRQLLAEGDMHNRARMITASFLSKNLLLPWQWGERYFAENLLDFECSSNVGSWQWSASTGADAQPYFRIFNPYLQAKKFDPQCAYIKKWIPELRDISPKTILSEEILKKTCIIDYPKPMLSIQASTARAKEAFKGKHC